MHHPTPNPYLAWLAEAGDPPFPLRLAEATQAAKVLERRVQQGLRQLCRQPSVAHYMAFEQAHQDGLALCGWVDQTGPHSVRVPAEPMRMLVDRLDHAMIRAQSRLVTEGKPALTKLLRQRGLSPHVRHLLRRELDRPVAEGKAYAHSLRLRRAHERRAEALVAEHARAEGVWLPAAARLNFLPQSLRQEARAAARVRNRSGFVFLPHTAGSLSLQAHHPEAAVRQQAWAQDQAQPSQLKHIEAMRRARQATLNDGQVSYAHDLLEHDAALHDGAAVERALARGVQEMQRTTRHYLKRHRQAKHRTAPRVEHHWDQLFEETQLTWPPVPTIAAEIFPWEATVQVAVPEMMAQGGWHLDGTPQALEQGTRAALRFCFVHPGSGRRAEVWYSPFDPSPTPNTYAGAWMRTVREAWGAQQGHTPLIWIAQTLDPQEPSFQLDHLEYLAHEVGHTLHYLSMPGQVPGETDSTAIDISEFPAYLFQLYCRDPQVLARWAHREGPKAAQRARYWGKFLHLDPSESRNMGNRLGHALLDLYVHRRHPEDVSYVAAREWVAQLQGEPLTPDMASFWTPFLWENDFAALDYTHVMGQALVHRLVRLHAHGQVQASSIAQLHQDLLTQVLSHSSSPHRLNRAWRRWMGEGLRTSWMRGLDAMTRHHRQVLHAHLPRSQGH